MKYLCIDIETTGLNPWCDQILEIGIVIDDLRNQQPVEHLPSFHTYVDHDDIHGDAVALAMNSKILERIGKKEPGFTYFKPPSIGDAIISWLADCNMMGRVEESFVAAGKNFGAFDLQFLKRLPDFRVNFRHRYLDPAMYFLQNGDAYPPSLQVCLERAGIQATVPHTAVEDARLVVQVLRAGWNNFIRDNPR